MKVNLFVIGASLMAMFWVSDARAQNVQYREVRTLVYTIPVNTGELTSWAAAENQARATVNAWWFPQIGKALPYGWTRYAREFVIRPTVSSSWHQYTLMVPVLGAIVSRYGTRTYSVDSISVTVYDGRNP